MKNKQIERCIELIEELRLMVADKNSPTGNRLEKIYQRLDFLEEVFKIQKEWNDGKGKTIALIDKLKKEKIFKE
jgi:hypothetical protein